MYNILNRNEIGVEIFPYLQKELSNGNSFALALLTTAFTGKVFTYLPLDIHPYEYDLSQLVEFTQSSNLSHEGKKEIQKYVYSFLQTNRKRVALIETYYSRDDLPKLKNTPRVVSSGDEIYFLLGKQDNPERIIAGFRSARHYPFICGLFEQELDGSEIQEKSQIETEAWPIIATRTQVVIIGAYDHTGFLIWEREYKQT